MPTLIDFHATDEAARWHPIADGVMSGVSHGAMHAEPANSVFSGELSLSNGDGFASLRREPHSYRLADYPGLCLEVCGDGRRYQLRLYSNQLIEGAAYRAVFQPPAGEWQRIALPWNAFEPVFRGRLLEDAPPLAPGDIQQIGLLIADRRDGPFRLALSRLETLGKESATAESQETRLRLVYDGECPICRRYVRWQRIRKEVGELELIDARQDSEARQELTALGIDLDQGFALQIGKRWYHGSEALQRLTLLGTRSGVFNRLMYRLFASPGRTARIYPLLRACRNGLLRVLGKPRIGNTRHG